MYPASSTESQVKMDKQASSAPNEEARAAIATRKKDISSFNANSLGAFQLGRG